MSQKFVLALCQHTCPVDASAADNWQRFEALARQAARQGASVILSQELFLSWYFCQGMDEDRFDLADAVPGGWASQKLSALAAELSVTIQGSLFERTAPGLHHNTSVTFGPDGKLIGRYRKMHIPHDPRFEEKYCFAPGDLGFQIHQAPQVALGPLVCWDQWYPEAARLTAMQGAQLLCYPTAIGWYNDPQAGEPEAVRAAQRDAWITMQRSHAIANGVFVAACNRVGVERELTFWGSSFICAPDGTVLASGSEDSEEVVLAEVDTDVIETQRRGWPFFRDRRVDAYGDLLKRWSAS